MFKKGKMVTESVRELFNKIMAKRHRLAKCIASCLERQKKPEHAQADSNVYFHSLMDKYRMCKNGENNGEELRECMTSFYLEHVKDIELLSRLHAEND